MLLEIQNLHAGYDGYEVLHGVSLSCNAGECVALIGSNGAGKSTILKAAYGLARVMAGEVEFGGEAISGLPTHARIENGLGFVPQGRLVFPNLTVEENLDMGGYLLDHKETLAANKDKQFSRFPMLFTKRREKAGTLSGGQQQQLAVARALMTSPKLMMLDEPTLGLSPKLMHEVFETIEGLRADGTGILVVEQNVRLVLEYADRGYLLANGEVRFAGSAKDLGHEDRMRACFLK